MRSNLKVALFLLAVSYFFIFSSFLWNRRSPKCLRLLGKSGRGNFTDRVKAGSKEPDIQNILATADITYSRTDIYEQKFLKCEDLHSNASLLPDRINQNTPRAPYKECGVEKLLIPHGNLFQEKSN